MFFKVKIPAESLAAFLACKWFLVIMRVHVKCQIVHLVESLAADVALEGFLASMSESVIFIIALLMKTLSANITHKWLVTSVDSDVSVQRRGSVKRLPTDVALVRFLLCVDDLVAA